MMQLRKLIRGAAISESRLAHITRLHCLLFLLMLPAATQGQFLYTTNSGTVIITGYAGQGDAANIPNTILGLPVTGIGPWAFYSSSVTNVTIPDSVVSIGDGAFFDCESLINISVGTGVTNIGDWAFAFCSTLSSVCFRGNAPALDGADVFYGNLATVFYLPTTTGWGPRVDGHPAALWNPPVP
ncbi:MAG: leucine-rich repeat domain-containing protein, partial [Verrucomicrobiota bacterium]